MINSWRVVYLTICCSVVSFGIELPKSSFADEPATAEAASPPIKVGILGMDNYQCVAFMQLWHQQETPENLAGLRIVAAYPGEPSPRIEKSADNLQKWIERAVKNDVKIVASPAELLPLVDAVILMSTDATHHLEEVRPVLAAGKPVYIGRPMVTSLVDAVRIFNLAKESNCPIFSCSQHRFSPGFVEMREHPEVGKVTGCDVYGGYPPEQPVDDAIWGALHGIETLQTIMGAGCESVARTSTDDAELLSCVYADGRIGTWRGMRKGAVKYSAVVYGEKGIGPAGLYGYAAPVGGVAPKTRYMGYEGVAVEIASFFKTKQPPVTAAETLEVFAILEAAKISKSQGGIPVKIADVLKAAEEKVAAEK
jgi:predicted dehydrogenase